MKPKLLLRSTLAAALLPLVAVSVASPLHAAEPADVDTRLKLLEARWATTLKPSVAT